MKDEKTLARNYLYRCLARQSYSAEQLRRKLTQKKIASTSTIESVIKELEEAGYIDDQKVCESTIYRNASRGAGPRAIRKKLYEKGIDNELVNEAMINYENEDVQKERISFLLQTKFKLPDGASEKDRARVIRSLLRKGYPLSLILEVINSLARKG